MAPGKHQTITMQDFWHAASAQLESELTPQQFKTWIKPLTPLSFDEQACMLRIAAPNRFKLDWVKSQFSGRIQSLACDYWEMQVDVQFVLDPTAGQRQAAMQPALAPMPMQPLAAQTMQAQAVPREAPARPTMAPYRETPMATAAHAAADIDVPVMDAAEASTQSYRVPAPAAPAVMGGLSAPPAAPVDDTVHERSRLNPILTFDNLVTGKANQLARAAAVQVANNPGKSYNPLYLYGGVGLGKTHLIHAIGNFMLMENPRARIRYIHAEQYVSDVVKAYQRKAFDDFKRYYHSLDLLLIDDIQFFSGKNRTQEEFFYAFEALIANRAQVIITSDTYPKEITGIDDRLISRFDSGLTVAIEPPELEMRVAILMKKAQAENVTVPEEVAFFVAKHLRSNVRELEGALRKILAYSNFHGKEITIEVTREALKDLLTVQNRQISVENIQKTCADFYNIKVADMYSKKRPANIARPRQIAMYLAKELTQKSLPEIGELFGGRDHTTVLHAVRKIADERSKDAQLNHELHVLEQTLKG
ncbi:chromosomal replication initiator protein DnaA [Ralstonia solanacearum]|nr:chromosomal replication initiation protein DnaA [Ralstonia pseudosolanacearum]AXV72685.1 chromosomal replication initiator protein DnaA [Ralstonia solanacearum]AXW13616.1 chromosomal replication initiator protein DnaA [Ralstonia solanacearum]AXW36820.1 chromosomal replication initiator protein DnaA [Ralstonia solanacearum]AXW69669.1 chromosomal replication initiator protein DnaA [Ralstonia solanacearum]